MWLLQPGGLPNGTTVADLPFGNNTLTVPWASVNDVLGHRATRAFITHCGAVRAAAALLGRPTRALPQPRAWAETHAPAQTETHALMPHRP